MGRVFAFVPVGKLDAEHRTIVRIGYTKTNKPLDRMFQGFERARVKLLWIESADPHEKCEELKALMRGHYAWGGERFKLFENQTITLLGDKFFGCPYTIEELEGKFGGISYYLEKKEEPEPDVDLSGLTV